MYFLEFDSAGIEQAGIELNEVAEIAEWYPRISGHRLNFVINSTSALTTDSSEVTNHIDRLFLKAIRSNSDLIVTTGLTARIEHLKASRYAPILVLTKQPLSGIPLVDVASEQPIFITADQGNYKNPKVANVGTTKGPLGSWLASFTKNYQSVVLETGITTAKQIADAGLLTEACITVTGGQSFNTANHLARRLIENIGLNATQLHCLNNEETWIFRFLVSQ